MPRFITSIQLQEATEKDYDTLSREMKKNAFMPVRKIEPLKSGSIPSFSIFNSTHYKSLLDTTAIISLAAATTGRKYSFTVIKEKSKQES